MNEPILTMKGISKRFPGVQALERVDFDLRKGEIHALIGENGAGKSTLMKILGGVNTLDEGRITLNGKPVTIASPHDSIANRIGVIYQEFNLVQTLNVYENLYLGKEIRKGVLRQLDRAQMLANARSNMEKLGIANFDCTRKIKTLSVAMQQLVEIGKAIFNQIDILVMDEPTAVLTDKESNRLFEVINGLRATGVSIIYISHRLEEVLQLADRISILRDGRLVETVENDRARITKDYLVQKMVGRDLGDYFPHKTNEIAAETAFEVRGLTRRGLFEDISFSVRKGEILGFSGLIGAGRSEIMKAIFGVIPIEQGTILINGTETSIQSPLEGRKKGVAFVPEDRKREGLVLGMSMANNIAMSSLESLSTAGHIHAGAKRDLVRKYIGELQIRPNDPHRRMVNFSGGNQQKAVIAKWLATKPKVVILDEPTRGIDIGAKVEIYNLINELAARHVGVIVISSELTELIGICDRILVINTGRITGEFERGQFSQDAIMYAATHFSSKARPLDTGESAAIDGAYPVPADVRPTAAGTKILK